MKDISDVTACVVDCGLFLPFARRLAEDCKRVLFWSPDTRSFPSLKQGSIGNGFPDIERVLDFWPELPEIDLFCFCDVQHSGLQLHLESIGKSVWGSRTGDKYELGRELFMETLGELGLDVPKFVVIVGLDALREHLKDQEDKYIKVSRWRGDLETTHWRTWAMDNDWLDWQAVNLGPLKNKMRFLVFDKIETDLEIGGDTYCIDGEWPGQMLYGLEHKDTTYFSRVAMREAMPDQLAQILERFSPLLKECQYRNQWSMEVRIKEDKSYFIDATCRGGMPSSASQQLLWENFSEIVWAGANGEMVRPKPVGAYSIECMVTTKSTKDCWDVVELPQELERHVRFSNCCFVDGCYAFPPEETHSGDLGWLCAIGNTPRETLEEAKRLCDLLPDGCEGNIENLTGLIAEIESAKDQNVPFTDDPVPEPAEVIAE